MKMTNAIRIGSPGLAICFISLLLLFFTIPFAGAATLTIGKGVVIQGGAASRLVVRDTLSAEDCLFTSGMTAPMPGDWLGLLVHGSSSGTLLNGAVIEYAKDGLEIHGSEPILHGISIRRNSNAGIIFLDGASPTVTGCILLDNGFGLVTDRGAQPTIRNSFLSRNGYGLLNRGQSTLIDSIDNWWGHPSGPLDASDDTQEGGYFNPAGLGDQVSDRVDYVPWLQTIPILGATLDIAPATVTETREITLLLACRTCTEYRASENADFVGAVFAPFTESAPFTLSGDDDLKTIHVQFRTATGNTGGESSSSVRLDTAGPTLTIAGPEEGAVITRPAMIDVSADDPAGLAMVEFYIDGILTDTRTSGNCSFTWDVRAESDGGHEIKVVAHDTLGHASTEVRMVTVSKTPPATPAILTPLSGILDTDTVDVTGSAEPGIAVTLYINGTVAGRTTADFSGNFQFSGVALVEGANSLTAVAVESWGTSPSSAPVLLNVDTGPPPAPYLYEPKVAAGGVVKLMWAPGSGEAPAHYNLYRAASTFSDPAEATLINGDLTVLSLTDLPVADGLYYYGLTAVDAVGNESSLSTVLGAASDRTPPAAEVAFSPLPPVGPGTVDITLTSSEPLAEPPYLGLAPAGDVPMVIALTEASETEWTGIYEVSANTPHGLAALVFAGKDATGNKGDQIATGSTLAIDTRGPAGALQFTPAASLYQPGEVAVSLALDEAAATTPSLHFTAPSGAAVDIPLTGNGASWSGLLEISAAMGDGEGHFVMTATDALGNSGANLATGDTITLDVTPPATPEGLVAVAQPGGKVELTWNLPAEAASYRLYRGASVISLPMAPLVAGPATGGYLDLPANDDTYHYAITALDAAGNESLLSSEAVATADREAPGAPGSLSNVLDGTTVQLSWSGPEGETAASYRLYRAAAPIASIDGLTPLETDIGATNATDTPAEDGAYYYAVTALDAAGNESPPSAGTSLVYNLAPPVITVAGVVDGQFSPGPVAPVVTVTSASLAGRTTLLDGQPFADGTAVDEEGAHLLRIEATDTSDRTTVKEIAFTIDLTDPVVVIGGVTEGSLYETAVTPVITVTDSNPDTTTITLNGAPYTSGTPIGGDGDQSLKVVATDKAGRSETAVVVFTVDTAPPPPAGLTVTAIQGAEAVLDWGAAAAEDVAGYFVYRNGAQLTAVPLTELTFTDGDFDGEAFQSYEVSAVDAAGREGARLTAEVPPVQVELKRYGRPNGDDFILSKQYIESFEVDIVNDYGLAVAIDSMEFELSDHEGLVAETVQEGPINLEAGGVLGSEQILPVGNGIVDYRLYDVTLALTSEPGVTVKRLAAFKLNAFDPGRKVELFSEPVVKGGTAKIRLKIYNHGSAPIEVLTSSGDQPSPEVYVLMKDQDGNILAKGNLNQRGIGVLNHSGYALAEIAPGETFLSEPVEFVVPAAVPDTVYLEAYVKKIYHHYQQADQIVAGDFGGYITVALNQPAYIATIEAENQVYDQNTPVLLFGSVLDTVTGELVPDAPVKIGIGVKGFDRYLLVAADSAGNFSTTFTPLNGEAGNYSLWATHPEVKDKPIQAGFTIHGLVFDPSAVNLRMSKNSSFTMPITLKNPGETALNDLRFEVTGGPGIGGAVDTSGSATELGGGKTTTVKLTLTADPEAPDAGFASLSVTTAQGINRVMPVNISLLPALPAISTEPSYIDIGVSRNNPRAVTFKLKNVGHAPLRDIVIQPPALPWIGLLSGPNLPDLAPGESVDIGVNFRPGDSVAQGPWSDKLIITSGNHVPYTLNLFPTVSSTGKGSVMFQVIDSLNEKVAGASVTIAHQSLGSILLSGTTDAEGELSFLDITEGMYNYKVQAPGHELVVGTLEIASDVVTPIEVFMNNVFVTYEWSVQPMTLTDNYDMTLQATFETQVPAPVIVIEPAYQKLDIEIGSTFVGEYRVTNHGLVALDDVVVNMTGDPGLRVETLVTDITRLGPGETVVIPYRITVNPFKSPMPVEACSKLKTKFTVGGGYVCLLGIWVGAGAVREIEVSPRERYDMLGLCDAECDWCDCLIKPEAVALCKCARGLYDHYQGYATGQGTDSPLICECLSIYGREVADTICSCIESLSSLTDEGPNTTGIINCASNILGSVPLQAASSAASALDAFRGGFNCGLCIGDMMPDLPSYTGTTNLSEGQNYGDFGTGTSTGTGFTTGGLCQ